MPIAPSWRRPCIRWGHHFSGESLSTDPSAVFQVRAGAARLVSPMRADATSPRRTPAGAATLVWLSHLFNCQFECLLPCTWLLRNSPEHNRPTIGKVTVLNPKELIARALAGQLRSPSRMTCAKSGRRRYRILLDPNAPTRRGRAALAPRVMAGRRSSRQSKFIWYASPSPRVTVFALLEVFESPTAR